MLIMGINILIHTPKLLAKMTFKLGKHIQKLQITYKKLITSTKLIHISERSIKAMLNTGLQPAAIFQIFYSSLFFCKE